ncbi:hypothetical protein BHM03_00058822, partial [Ensete ventricosum]
QRLPIVTNCSLAFSHPSPAFPSLGCFIVDRTTILYLLSISVCCLLNHRRQAPRRQSCHCPSLPPLLLTIAAHLHGLATLAACRCCPTASSLLTSASTLVEHYDRFKLQPSSPDLHQAATSPLPSPHRQKVLQQEEGAIVLQLQSFIDSLFLPQYNRIRATSASSAPATRPPLPPLPRAPLPRSLICIDALFSYLI